MSEGVSIIVGQESLRVKLNNWKKKYHAKWFVLYGKCWM